MEHVDSNPRQQGVAPGIPSLLELFNSIPEDQLLGSSGNEMSNEGAKLQHLFKGQLFYLQDVERKLRIGSTKANKLLADQLSRGRIKVARRCNNGRLQYSLV